jgi:hypothetical protein
MKDIVALRNGPLIVNVHTVDRCAGQHCVIHNPSQHHMLTWEPIWDGADKQMWRECPHGFPHPDPDDVTFLRRRWGSNRASLRLIHGCDGCCQPHVQEIEGGNK